MVEPDRCYFIYTDLDFPDHYLARGTDGKLYLVPATAGGWMRRRPHDRARIQPQVVVSPASISEFLGGSEGEVHIAALSDDLMVGLGEAALVVGIPSSTLKNARREGRLVGAEAAGGDWLLPTAGLRQYLANGFHPRPTRRR